jgi:iron complex outermembrane receptor protein
MSVHRKVNRVRRSTVLSTAVSSCLAMAAGHQAMAQSAELDEVIVTGFRASLQDALEKKRESIQIIESITAEDIGKFPDQNVAESLQRLPGIQIDRENGQGTKVRIRGLSQNVTLLNEDIFLTGLEIYKVGEGNFERDSSLEGIPSELLGGLDVFKSPIASQLEGGLGGVVNLRTRSPFDFNETTIAGNVRMAESTDSDESAKPLGAVVFGHRFSDALAITASLSYDKQDTHTDVLGGDNRGGWRLSDRPASSGPNLRFFAPEYRYVTDRDEERERLGGSVAIGFRPNDSMEIEAQWFHSDLELTTKEASFKFAFAGESATLDTAQPYEIDGNGVLLSGTMLANSAEAISYVKNTEVSSDNLQVKFKFDNGGTWRASGAAAYSMADMEGTAAHADVRYTAYTVRDGTAGGLVPNAGAPATYAFTFNNNGGTLPAFGLAGDQSLFANPANGFFKSHWVFGDKAETDNWSLRGDVEFEPAFLEADNIKFSSGLRFAGRDVDYEFGRYLADYHGKGELDGIDFGQDWTAYGYFQDGAIGYKSCELPIGTPGRPTCSAGARFGDSPALITPYQTFLNTPGRVESINNFWGSGAFPGNSINVQDRSQMSNGVAWIQGLYPSTPFQYFQSPLESFKVEEKTTSAYVMVDVGNADDNYHINIGTRIIRTDLEVFQNAALPNPRYWGTDSWNGVLMDFETVRNERSYTDILPSANIVLDVTENNKVRFSAARVVSRQDLFQLGRGFSTNFTRDTVVGSPTENLFLFTNGESGNAELDPYRATQFDLGNEYYFGTQGLVGVTFFWKEVDSFVTRETKPEFVMDQSGGRFGPVTRPVNGTGGYIRGLELNGQYAFDFGLGFAANYTYSKSASPVENDIESNLPIDGVSKHSFNTQVYFEKAGFESRLSYVWRDKSFDGNFGFADGATALSYGIWNRDYGQLDMQLAYNFFDRKLGVTLEVLNITEEEQSQYLQYENLPFTYSSGSMRVLLGVRGSFGF